MKTLKNRNRQSFNITVEKHILNLILSLFSKTAQRLELTRGCNLETNIFKSSNFCQPLFGGSFTITPEWMTNSKLP